MPVPNEFLWPVVFGLSHFGPRLLCGQRERLSDRKIRCLWWQMGNDLQRPGPPKSIDEVLVSTGSEPSVVPPDFHANVEDDGQLVVVRPQVVETAGHVLGNLFQRIYHSIDQVRAGHVALADDLTATSRQLEECLQLLIDYVAPLPPLLQKVPAGDIVQSLARHLEDTLACAVQVDEGLDPRIELLVDVARLSRAFDLLAGRADGVAPGNVIEVAVGAVAASGTLAVTTSLQSHGRLANSSLSELRWAVVEKLFEIHGGSVREEADASGEIRWNILLPLQA